VQLFITLKTIYTGNHSKFSMKHTLSVVISFTELWKLDSPCPPIKFLTKKDTCPRNNTLTQCI